MVKRVTAAWKPFVSQNGQQSHEANARIIRNSTLPSSAATAGAALREEFWSRKVSSSSKPKPFQADDSSKQLAALENRTNDRNKPAQDNVAKITRLGIKMDYGYLKFRPSLVPKPKAQPPPDSQEKDNIAGFDAFVFANEDQYDGQYTLHGLSGPGRSGYGKYICANDSVLMGHWQDNQLSGADCFIKLIPQAMLYKGAVHNGKFEGFGVFRGQDGLYEGGFRSGKCYGPGRIITNHGLTWTGRFDESKALNLQLDLQLIRDFDVV